MSGSVAWLRQLPRWLCDLWSGARYVYLAADKTNSMFRCRGRVPSGFAPTGFARQMARHGLQVRVVKFYRGEQIKEI